MGMVGASVPFAVQAGRAGLRRDDVPPPERSSSTLREDIGAQPASRARSEELGCCTSARPDAAGE